MGNHRMFANSIIDTDRFLDMPLSTQALYFHLGMRADDDGFIGSPKKILRGVNCSEDDLKLLTANGYLIPFDSGIIAIAHWNVNNSIRKDRKKETFYKKEMGMLCLVNDIYSLDNNGANRLTTNCQPNDDQMTAQEKIREDKKREDKEREDKKEKEKENNDPSLSDSLSYSLDPQIDHTSVMCSFNRICPLMVTVDAMTDTRKRAVESAADILGDVSFDELFGRVQRSDFLSGRSGKWYGCNFDWILRPENLRKILSGAYDNPEPKRVEQPMPAERRNTSYDLRKAMEIENLDFVDDW